MRVIYKNVKELLIETLEESGYNVYLQGSLTEGDQYEDNFFTIWNPEVPQGMFYNNQPNEAIHLFYVNFFSIDPGLVFMIPRELISKLEAAGFTVHGLPSDAMSDETTHTAAMLSVSYVEKYKRED